MGLISNGTTIFDNGALAVGGSMTFISSATASSSASIEFTLGDYKEYKFFFVNMNPVTNGSSFQINFSTDNGSNYNVTKTSSSFDTYHRENGTGGVLRYTSGNDLAQSTSDQLITGSIGNTDGACVGIMHLFNPSSETYVKHYILVSQRADSLDPPYSVNDYVAGYANTVSPLTNVIFRMSSGNIDDGKILMFGLN